MPCVGDWYWFATQAQVWRGYKGQIIHGVSGRPSKLKAWLITSISWLNGYAPKSLITGCFVAFACISYLPVALSNMDQPLFGMAGFQDWTHRHIIWSTGEMAKHSTRAEGTHRWPQQLGLYLWGVACLRRIDQTGDELQTGFEQHQWDFNHGCGSKLSTFINPKVLDGFWSYDQCLVCVCSSRPVTVKRVLSPNNCLQWVTCNSFWTISWKLSLLSILNGRPQ